MAGPPKVEELTEPQRRALRRRQIGLFGTDSIFGPGTTLAALRRRGVVVGRQPHADLTAVGEQLCNQLESGEPENG